MRTLLILLVASAIFPSLAWSQAPNWEQGLNDLHHLALTENNENLAAFIQVGDQPGQWIYPDLSEQKEDVIWINIDGLKKSFTEYLEKASQKKDQKVNIFFAHTHPLKTIRHFVADPAKRHEVYDVSVSPVANDQYSISPSRTDLMTIYSVEKNLKAFFKKRGYKQSQVVGLVVCPMGLYFYRPLHKRSQKVQMFPELADQVDFAFLDNEAQEGVQKKLNQDYFDAKVAWTTLLNQSRSPGQSLMQTDTFYQLQLAYAAHPASVILDFTLFKGTNQNLELSQLSPQHSH